MGDIAFRLFGLSVVVLDFLLLCSWGSLSLPTLLPPLADPCAILSFFVNLRDGRDKKLIRYQFANVQQGASHFVMLLPMATSFRLLTTVVCFPQYSASSLRLAHVVFHPPDCYPHPPVFPHQPAVLSHYLPISPFTTPATRGYASIGFATVVTRTHCIWTWVA